MCVCMYVFTRVCLCAYINCCCVISHSLFTNLLNEYTVHDYVLLFVPNDCLFCLFTQI